MHVTREPQEAILQQLPGATTDQRLLVLHVQDGKTTRIELRQQSWGEGVGWYTQSSVSLEPAQWSALRGGVSRPARSTPTEWQPRIVRAESA
ncbi:MAG: hypothetical protein QF805_14125 [Pirellulaceae bacterium]|jgi:hypothetical protein|nr:hypothetical protein [Pirellulaceae bacterium]